MAIEIEILRKLTLFNGLDAAHLQFISEKGRKRTYKTDEAIVRQDDPGETFYLVVQGTAKVSTTMSDGKEVFLALIAAGDTFGELSLIDHIGRAADVFTQEETTLIALDRPAFDHLLDQSPAFAHNLLKVLTRRLRLANVRIQAMATLDVYGLVARQILEFAELYGIEAEGGKRIPMRLTQSNMADLVGASRERVNQVMVAYRNKDYITVDSRYHITVLKPDDLRNRCR